MLTIEKLKMAIASMVDSMDSWELIETLENYFTKEEIIELGFEAEWKRVKENEEDEEDDLTDD